MGLCVSRNRPCFSAQEDSRYDSFAQMSGLNYARTIGDFVPIFLAPFSSSLIDEPSPPVRATGFRAILEKGLVSVRWKGA